MSAMLKNFGMAALGVMFMATAAQADLPSFAPLARKAGPAVVNISTEREVSSPVMDMFNIPGMERFFEQFGGFGGRRGNGQEAPKRKSTALGSGFIISSDGYIVTNNHVVEGADKITVNLNGGKGKGLQAKVIGTDADTDLALLKVEGRRDLPVLEFGNSDAMEVGDWVLAIGNPLGLNNTVTAGILSAKGRDLHSGPYDNFLQTDASINPGNSGGPLVNIKGEIVGINQFIMTGGASRGSIGLGFSIASNLVKQVTDNLIQDGEVARPFLGISMQELDENLRSQFEADYGVVVSSVLPGEAAERAGVNAGDIIQKINGVKVQSPHALLLAVTSYRPGDKIKLTLLRSGKEMEFELIAGKRGVDGWTADGSREPRDANASESSPEQLGLKLTEEDGKIVVEEVFPDGAAARVGGGDVNLQPGDIIHEINRQPVRSLGDVRKALKQTNKNKVMLWVERKYRNRSNSFRFYIVIPLD